MSMHSPGSPAIRGRDKGSAMAHISVLLQETIQGLAPRSGDTVLDGTGGGGGHALALCREVGTSGTIIVFDQDDDAIERVRERLASCDATKHLVHDNFRNLAGALDTLGIATVDRVILDLGLSSFQLDEAARGFSFRQAEPLTMTFAKHPGLEAFTAYDVVNTWDEEHIADVIFGYGEERYARTIARAIVKTRAAHPIETTVELAEVIKAAVPLRYAHGRIHPATRTFQAIRIAVNDELGALEEGLESAWKRLAAEGRIAVISFHSLEDRIVKRFFKEREREGEARILTKRPIEASDEECHANPRARSAKLRIAEKIIST